MSKQLTGALFVDIQGDNKNLKKSLNDSKQQVAGFGTFAQAMFAANPALNALLGGGAVAGIAGAIKGFRGHRGFSQMRRDSASGMGLLATRRYAHRVTLGSLRGERPEEIENKAEHSGLLVTERNKLRQARKEHAAAKHRDRGGRGMLGHSRGQNKAFGMLRNIGFGANMAGYAVKSSAAFLATGAGMFLLAGAVTAVIGTIMGSAIKRGGEGRQFDVKSIREDALTKIARIKQNIQIGKNTMGQGFRGGAERFYDRQAAGLAPAAATAGNVFSGAFWGLMGLIGWNMRGGVAGGIGRWATGGDFF